MGKITTLSVNSASTGGVGSAPTFGHGFNVNGNNVTWAQDDPSNMFFDPGFEDTPPLVQWTQSPAGSFIIDATLFFNGGHSARSSTPNAFIYQTFRCNPGDQFVLTVYSRTSGPAAGVSAAVLRVFDVHGAFLTQFVTNINPSTSWVQYKVSGVMPANAYTVQAWPINVSVTAGGAWYVDSCLLRRIADSDVIAVGAIQTTHLAVGSLGDLSKYSSTVRAIGITNGLPALPDPNYPTGAIIFDLFDGKLYRNVGGAWSKGSDPQDLIAGTIAAGVIYAGQINAGQVNAGTFNGCSLVLNLNGITTTVNNGADPTLGQFAGLVVSKNSTNQKTVTWWDGYVVYNTNSWPVFAVTEDASLHFGTLDIRGPGGFSGCGVSIQGGSFAGLINVYGTSAAAYFVNSVQVLTVQQTGPGNPSFASFAAVQTWCQNLLNALRVHGMLT